jgi:hypothetical protein
MSHKRVKDLLWKISKPYPRLQGLLMREVGSLTQGQIWCNAVIDSGCNLDSFEDVCYQFIDMKRSLPEPVDRLIFDLIQDAKDLNFEKEKKLEQHMKYHRPKAGEVMGWVRNDKTGTIAVTLGTMVKQGSITEEESSKRVDQLFQLERGEIERPEWLDAMPS